MGDREGYWERERVREREGKRERDVEWPSNRGRVGLTLKLDDILWPSMTF